MCLTLKLGFTKIACEWQVKYINFKFQEKNTISSRYVFMFIKTDTYKLESEWIWYLSFAALCCLVADTYTLSSPYTRFASTDNKREQ